VLPKQLITAWVNHKRPKGGILTTNKKSIVKALHLLYSVELTTNPFNNALRHIDKKGSLSGWLEDDVKDEKRWEWLIDCQLRRRLTLRLMSLTHRETNKEVTTTPPPLLKPRPTSKPPNPRLSRRRSRKKPKRIPQMPGSQSKRNKKGSNSQI
jgi:hypothetical protein